MLPSRLQFGAFSLVKTYLHIAPNCSRSPAMLYSRILVWLDLFPYQRLERWRLMATEVAMEYYAINLLESYR